MIEVNQRGAILFDLAVIAAKDSKKGAGILVAGLGLHGRLSRKNYEEKVSRIQFSIEPKRYIS